MIDGFQSQLKVDRAEKTFQSSLEPLQGVRRFLLICDWLSAWIEAQSQSKTQSQPDDSDAKIQESALDEAAAALLSGDAIPDATRVVQVSVRRRVEGLIGQHPTIGNQSDHHADAEPE